MATDPLDPETDFPLHIFSKEKEGEIFKGGEEPLPPLQTSRWRPKFVTVSPPFSSGEKEGGLDLTVHAPLCTRI